ncbi:SAM-dependent methyltransferase [Pseudomonas straminea]|uniref:tRNA (Adenine22-N1)-methyltransferase n=1 Tax=Pseudomonas straminea TaxID=47882 RepID=A0A1I1WNY3_PSEOC|nr:tRNA (adenine(22)-N(1))-methyltransferase TrmK [Pseudomonas straminea]GLX15061.1 SAM-dependent methyltransferase [Pseudomonas straminea]SFD96729.1 tRNA (adenine22-N1)-methyltransferase [Pseudomonas straminea]
MNPRQLSARLERVAAQVPTGARLADIGTDHGYLLVALMQRGVISAAVAGEVALTPLRAVARSVREHELGDRIAVRLADGLAAIEPGDHITAISFCGMGGETIRDILARDRTRLAGNELLILQPNGGEQPLRQWLMDNGYRIRHEELLQENRFFYEIIVAAPSEPTCYSERELYFGPLLLQDRSPAFLAKWQRLLRLKQKTLAGLTRAQQGQTDEKLERQVRWIDEMLAADGGSAKS